MSSGYSRRSRHFFNDLTMIFGGHAGASPGRKVRPQASP
jgi:hypothetical protein